MLSNDAAESLRSNIEIFPGDTVVVSRAGVVYVVGRCSQTERRGHGERLGHDGAAGHCHGRRHQPDAALNKSKLIRRTPNGPKEMPLHLKDMLASKAPDVRLQAEDIIFVPNSAAKSASKRTLEAIISNRNRVGHLRGPALRRWAFHGNFLASCKLSYTALTNRSRLPDSNQV